MFVKLSRLGGTLKHNKISDTVKCIIKSMMQRYRSNPCMDCDVVVKRSCLYVSMSLTHIESEKYQKINEAYH